jgi:hypothetical protein
LNQVPEFRPAAASREIHEPGSKSKPGSVTRSTSPVISSHSGS